MNFDFDLSTYLNRYISRIINLCGPKLLNNSYYMSHTPAYTSLLFQEFLAEFNNIHVPQPSATKQDVHKIIERAKV